MSWSPQQEAAIRAVRQWLATPGPQVFRLFGYAGSGKTTLAKEMAGAVRGTVLYGAFTGKAALVLRQKGCVGASTIHSMIYKPFEDPVTGLTEFKLNPDSPVAHAALVIIDEVSMVGEELARDLLSYGTKVLVLGDPAQLPPVKGEGFFINSRPDVMLTEVHRQAAENPIIRMSMDVREGRRLQLGTYGESLVVARSSLDKHKLREMVLASDQLLCGLNKSRQTFNARIREIKELAGARAPFLPVVGDRLVCLKNNQELGLLNGGLWEVLAEDVFNGKVEMSVQSLDEPELSPARVKVPAEFFNGTEKTLDWRDLKRADQFTYGYALTCHKAQGSQWSHPLVFDESSVFREDAGKWLYTAITRAADRVTVVV
ncbi:exodeoxyribonuclease-5 [Microvirga lupini]|uniref:Exodeoxyribonuclease-5 n=1 Tax=Microvirga lupini TaxID=420324 RepID=A0A7W4VI90_9HYPH|nr:ATP-dependent RecD-like DNA helicase [Microvirga lupini]MBB3017607.1 exodeoxyribonuclease-5 [Microvirga lupini]